MLDPVLTTFLGKVLSAAGLDMERDVGRFVLADKQRIWLWGQTAGAAWSKALFFGIGADRLGMNLQAPPYQSVRMAGRRLLFAPPLSDVLQDASRKRSLWTGMQDLFS